MRTGAIVITWGAPVRGREQKGLEVFGRAVAVYDELAKEGRIHHHRAFFRVTGGGPSGMMVVEGELDTLLKLEGEDEIMRLKADAAQIVDDFQTCIYAGGSEETVGQMMANYLESMEKLGI